MNDIWEQALKEWEARRGDLLRGPYDQIDYRLPEDEEPEVSDEFSIPEEQWFSHCLLLAQTGSGKTNAIRWRLQQLIPRIAEGEASAILLEPKGSLTDEVLHHPDVIAMGDRLIVLEPGDPRITVNVLDGSIERVGRVLSTLSMDMTALQRDQLIMCIRAMRVLEESSLDMLQNIVRHGKDAVPLGRLPTRIADFFAYDFSESKYLKAKLNSLFTNEIFETLFHDHTSFKMLDAIERGSLIVVKQNRATNLYGRFWIEEVLDCMYPRMTKRDKTPAYLIIDEAQNFVDEHLAKMLNEGREAQIGIMMACHYLDQGPIAPAEVRNAVLTNTLLKFVAKTSSDIHNLSRSMGATEPRFISTLPRYTFAFFGPDMEEAEAVRLPLVEFPRGERDKAGGDQVVTPLSPDPFPPAPERETEVEPQIEDDPQPLGPAEDDY